jgi:peptide chain release factor 1
MINEAYMAYVRKLAERMPALENEMSSPAIVGDQKKYRKAVEEHTRLKRILDRADTYARAKKDVEEHRALVNDPAADADIKQLAAEELTGLEARVEPAENALMAALQPPDRTDARNAIVEIRAGTGGEEAALFAADLFRMYLHFAENLGWKVGMIDASVSSIGGYKEVIFSVEGENAYGTLKYESGGHRVQRVPETEAQGRIHTSAATVAVFPEADEEEDNIVIKAEDVRIDIFCSSGPGGQGVNTTYSAVRMTHLPTGLVAQSQDERSQQRNKAKAMIVLKARILEHRRTSEAERMNKEKRSMIGSGDRSERIRTYNFPQNRLTDHRINFTVYNLDRVMEGNLQPLLDALGRHDADLKLEKVIGSLGAGTP